MEVIFNFLLKNSYLIYITVGVFLIGTFLFVKKIGEKYFDNEMTWFIQNTIFRSYKSLLVFINIIFTIVVIFLIYSFYLNFWLAVIYSVLFFYLAFKIVDSKKRGYLNLREEFEFQKYSTSVDFIKKKDIDSQYRKNAYRSIIDKISRINIEEKEIYSNEFLKEFDKIFTFDNFNSKIENISSNKTTGQLFYRKFKLSLIETIGDIRKTNDDNDTLIQILSSYYYLTFDEVRGLHYNSKVILDEMKMIEKKQIKEVSNPIRKLTTDYNQTDLKNAIINTFILEGFTINDELWNAIQNFVYKNFKNLKGKSGTVTSANDFILVEYIDVLKKALIKEKDKINCTNKDISEIISLNFKSVKGVKTIENI